MKIAPFVILAVALSSCAEKEAKPEAVKGEESQANKQPPKGKIVPVEIVVGTMPELEDVCKTGQKPANTIYVADPSRQVFHCMGKLLPHVNHGEGSPLSGADVELAAGDQVRWFSTTHTFTVVSVVQGKESPTSPGAPPTPFSGAAFSLMPAQEVVSPGVRFVNGKTVQRYKVTFNITGLGSVDPDLICSM